MGWRDTLDDPAAWGELGVFETLRTRDGQPAFLVEHVERLEASLAWAGWSWERERALAELHARAAEPGEWKLNVLVTRTHTLVSSVPLDAGRVNAPVRCATEPWEPTARLPGYVKHTSRAIWVRAAAEAAERLGEPVDEVIWVDRTGCWTEANRSNVLAVRDGVVWTAPLDGRILPGVTRQRALYAARALGVPVVEAPPPAAGRWDELYLCSTLKELAAVVRLDGGAGPGEGPVGRRLRAQMAGQRCSWS